MAENMPAMPILSLNSFYSSLNEARNIYGLL
jgi:hypothetical protein